MGPHEDIGGIWRTESAVFGDDTQERGERSEHHLHGHSGIADVALVGGQPCWWSGTPVPAPPENGIEYLLASLEDLIPRLGRSAQPDLDWLGRTIGTA